MAFQFTGLDSTAQSANIVVYPDGVSSILIFDVTKQPFNYPFSTGIGPLSIVGPKSVSFVTPTSGNGSWIYDTVCSYDSSTFKVTVSFTKDLSLANARAPVVIESDATPFPMVFTFQYTSL